MKFLRFILVVAFLAVSSLRLRAALADGIQAVVNNTAITYAQVQEYVAPEVRLLSQEYAGQPDEYQKKVSSVLADGLEQLVERQLILHDFDAEGYKMPDSYVDQLVQDRIRDQFGDRITLMKTLQAQGETYEQFRQQVRDQYIISALRAKNVSQQIIISPYKVETYYLAHKDDYKVGEEVRLRMIVLNKASPDDKTARKLADEILSQIKGGASFSQMASIYSQGSQKSQGGDWGWVERSVLREKLADVAFSLKPGQVSDVIDLPESCYILKVEAKRPAHIKPLSEVRDDIDQTLRTQEQSQLQKQWIDSLKKKTFIRYF